MARPGRRGCRQGYRGRPRVPALPRPKALCHSCPRSPQQAHLPQALGPAVCESQQAPNGPLLTAAHSASPPDAPQAPSPSASVPQVWPGIWAGDADTCPVPRAGVTPTRLNAQSPWGTTFPPHTPPRPDAAGQPAAARGQCIKETVKEQDQEDIKQKGCQHRNKGPCTAPQFWPPAPRVLGHTPPRWWGSRSTRPWRGSGTIWHGKQGSVGSWP